MSIEDFIVIEIISFYIVLQTLNLFKTGPPGIVHFKGEKVPVKKIKKIRYLKIMHLLQ